MRLQNYYVIEKIQFFIKANVVLIVLQYKKLDINIKQSTKRVYVEKNR